LSAADRAVRVAMRVAYRAQLAWWFVRRPRIEGAYVAVWHGGRLLVIKNSYRTRFSLPAGGLRRGETPREAAVRELGEEVGIAAHPDALVYYDEIVVSSGYAEDHAHIFELRCKDEPADRVDGRDVVWAGFLAPEDAFERGLVRPARRYLERKRAAAG
jgi:8-oxo-dGTP pyrophosphatase MutT (NUDIX family)